MNKSNFDGAEITVYTTDGNTINLDLSKMQLFVAFKILGIDFKPGGVYSCHSDETLQKLLEYKGNPLNLVPRE